MHRVFGIRHHGPGSAKSLLSALKEMEPDCILIECPEDAEKVITYASEDELKPPVAILLYHLDHIQHATYYPFASFSPEWQAIKYGLKKKIPIQCIDLPRGISLHQQIGEQQPSIHLKRAKDPLYKFAQLAGYQDSERWWEATFESVSSESEIFDLINQLMTFQRSEEKTDFENELREAFMRKKIRAAYKNGYSNIAVICGAWHGPMLTDLNQFKSSDDNKLLKGLKKIKVQATWVPWSYERLSTSSGYGAGVISPAWYELIFDRNDSKTERFITKAARLFRKKDIAASAAHIIDACRLAETLAAMRELHLPGVREMTEAVQTVFWGGSKTPMKLIEKKLIIGQKSGRVGKKVPLLPIQKDFEKWVKKSRLSKLTEPGEAVTKILDLRKPTPLATSKFLHQLNILDLRWARLLKGSQFQTGSFNEKWKLKWKQDYWLRIIERSQWGNTIEEAGRQYLLHKINQTEDLKSLVELVSSTIKADYHQCIGILSSKIKNISTHSSDLMLLMQALPSLVNVIRYGGVRGNEAVLLVDVVHHILPKIAIALPSSVLGLKEDAGQLYFEGICAVNLALATYKDEFLIDLWNNSLMEIWQKPNAYELIKGYCLRTCWGREVIKEDVVLEEMQFQLSPDQSDEKVAQWLEGFLHGSGLLLIYNKDLRMVLNQWLQLLDMDRFKMILPYLRRTFSKFSSVERQKMLQFAKNQTGELTIENQRYSEKRKKMMDPLIKLLLN